MSAAERRDLPVRRTDGRLDIAYSGWGADLEIVAPPVG